MNTYAKLKQADRRQVILRTMAEDSAYGVNEYVLRRVLDSMKHTVSADLLRTDLRWLEEQGLLVTEDVSGTMVAKLTARGLDVASGAVLVPGVQQPMPEI
jgi:hypothetical protein